MAKEEPAKSKRRIVRKVETVREKAEKQAAAKPKKSGVLRLTIRYILWPLRPLGWLLKKLGRYLIPGYFKKSWAELKQVTWPGRAETWKLVLAVIIFSIVFGLLILVVDFGLDKIFRKVLID